MPLISHFPGGGGGGAWSVFTGSTPPASEPEGVFVKTTASPAGVVVTNQVGGARSWGSVNGILDDIDGNVRCLSTYKDNVCLLAYVNNVGLAVLSWNTVTQQLTTIPLNIDTPVFDQAMFDIYNGKLYCYGWHVSSSIVPRKLVYNLETKVVEKNESGANIENGSACIAVGSRMYFSGGGNVGSKGFFAWDLESGATISLAGMPRARSNHCMIHVANKLYVMGGVLSIGSSSTSFPIDIFDLTAHTWTSTNLSYTQSGNYAAVSGDAIGAIIYVASGTRMHAIDTNTMVMTELPGYSGGLASSVCRRVGNNLYFLNGGNAIIQYRVAGDSYPKGTVVIETGAGRPPVKLAAGDVTYRDSVACVYQHDGTKLVKVPARDRQAGGAWSAEF